MYIFYTFIDTCNEFSYLSNFNFIKTRELKTKNFKACDVTFEEKQTILKSQILSMESSGEFQVS
jgi:competence transcription factor ComK